MATQPFDADLRSELGNITLPAPSETAATGDGGAPPVPETPPAEPEGEHPEPDQAIAGSTPEDQPPASGSSAHESWVKRYGDPEKAAQQAFATERRVAESAKAIKEREKRIKELEALLGVESGPGSTPGSDESAPEEPESTDEDIDEILGELEPEHPAAAAPVPPAVVRRLEEAERADPECKALAEQYLAYGLRSDEILKRNAMGQVVGGKLPDLDLQIVHLQGVITALKDPLKAEAYLGLSELGEFERAQVTEKLPQRVRILESELANLRFDRRELVNELRDIAERRADLSQRYDGRRTAIQTSVLAPIRAAQRKAEIQKLEDQLARSFTQEWNQAVDTLFAALNIPADEKETRADLFAAMKTAALAHNGAIPKAELPAFLEAAAKRELQRIQKWKQEGMGRYADRKRGGGTVSTTGTQSTSRSESPGEKIDLQSLDDALLADLRAGRRATARV